MPINQKEILRRVRQWITYAEEDLVLAQYALNLSSGCPYRLIAYHAQQCAEKYLKAYLVFHLIDFPYSHDIQYLLKLCSGVANWANDLDDTKDLTVFAVTARYPGSIEVTKDDAKKAIDLATQVKQKVQQVFNDENADLTNEIMSAKDEHVTEIGVNWAIKQFTELLNNNVPAVHFYILQDSRSINMLMKKVSP
ncbi:MAG: HEPN domain-containing protein [Methanosarcinaceae archaeon]